MKKLVKYLDNLNMRNKLILCFSIVIIPIISICIAFCIYINTVLKESTINSLENSNTRISTQLKATLNEILTLSNSMTSNYPLINFLAEDHEPGLDLVYDTWEYADLLQYKTAYSKYLSEFYFYIEDPVLLDNGYIAPTPDNIREQEWYQNALSGEKRNTWIYTENYTYAAKGTSSLSFVRTVYNFSEILGVLRVGIAPSYFEGLLAAETYDTILIDSSGTIFASSLEDLVGSHMDDFPITLSTEMTTQKFLDDEYVFYSDKMDFVGTEEIFTIVTFSKSAALLESATDVTNFTAVIIFLGLALTITLGFILSKIITRRLLVLSANIHNATLGDLSTPTKLSGTDEIARLSQDFEEMLESINALIYDVYELNLQKEKLSNEQKDIKIQMLNSQINPHFLFNTLESIRMKALISNQEEIAKQMELLSYLLRESLNMDNNPINIEKELKLCETYLKIQLFRFPNTLAFSINKFMQLDKLEILPFTIQPIVENCINHGLEKTARRVTSINIMIMQNENFNIIKVIDTGKGMDKETLNKLQKNIKLPDIPKSHIGINNIYQRFKLLYGEDFDIQIASEENKGTSVTLYIPKKGDNPNV